MKTTTAGFLTAQTAPHVEPKFLLYLFEQWDYAITDRDSATQIQIEGNAPSWIANGAVFIIPFDDFDTYHTITSSPSYNAGTGKTTIVCSASTFGTDVVGMYLAQRTDVTNAVMENGFSEIRISTEGETLNSSLADDVQIALDNADQSYWNSDGSSGLFNSGRIFWVQIIFYLNGNATTFLVFGGTVYLPSLQPVSHLQTVEFIAHGHLKEMERYPGFRLTTENGKLPHIPGITLISITEPSGGLVESLHDVKFHVAGNDIKDLTIVSITSGMPAGWHVIKFQPPDLFQLDFGTFNQCTAGATGELITTSRWGKAYGVTLDLPETFDIEAREDWFYTNSRLNLFPDIVGKLELTYSQGKTLPLRPTFDRAIFHDSSGGTYTDIARFINAYDENQREIVGSVNDEIFIMCREPIVGIYFELDTDLVGTITWYYSTAFNTYATLTKTDGTSNFTQDGAVTWSLPGDWKPINASINSVEYENYYILKVKCTAYTSGSCDVKRALKHLQFVGSDGSKLVIRVQFEHLPPEGKDDTAIMRDNASAVLTPCAWRQNAAILDIITDLLDSANYDSSNRSLSNGFLTLAARTINIFGKAPMFNYGKKVTALLYYSSSPTGGSILYLGVEDELWKLDTMIGYTYIDRLDPYIRASDNYYFKLEIRKLALDGNGDIQGIAWKSYFDQPTGGQDYNSDIDAGRRTPAVVFRSSDLLTITEQNKIDATDVSIFNSGELCWRDGGDDGAQDYIGQFTDDSAAYGENVCVPFTQLVWHLEADTVNRENKTSLSDATDNTETYPIKTSVTSPGFYGFFRAAASAIGLAWSLGQKGFVVWDSGNDVWIVTKWTGVAWQMASVEYDGTVTDLLDLTNYLNQLLAGCYYNGKIYYTMMTWDDVGATFPGDYSDCSLKSIDSDGTDNTTLFAFASDAVQANQSLIASTEEKYCTILEMVYNETDDTIHGCLLNRNDFEYHYFVYDVTNDKLYSSQTGTGFTFNTHRQIKHFAYDSSDGKVYAAVVDIRNQIETAFLISAEFTPPVGAPAGTEIILTFEKDIVTSETDVADLCYGNTKIFGITSPGGYVFEYDEIFEPFIFLMDFGEDTFRENMDQLAQILNYVHCIGPERKFYLKSRETNIGSMSLTEADHYIQDSMAPINFWAHKYDGVEVTWENPLTGESGVERSGVFGWQRRILKIDNKLIQYPQLAKVVADQYADFYDHYRRELSFHTMLIYQLECRDKFQFSHSVNRFDFATATWWMIEELILNYWDFTDVVRAIEIA